MKNNKAGRAATHRFRASRKPVSTWFLPEDYDVIKQAAELDRRPVAQFVTLAAVAAAKKFLKEHQR